MSTPLFASGARTRNCCLAAGAALALLAGLQGADPVAAQEQKPVAGCPSIHEVHPTISADEALRDYAPPGFKVYPGIDDKAEKQVLRRKPIVNGGEIAEASADLSYYVKDEWVVRFRFDVAATRRFGDFTTRNIDHQFAIVLDGRAISVLWIREPILGGIGEINGGFTADDARHLSERINSGGCRS